MPESLENTSTIYAALDLGSNSFHLLIARFQSGKLEVLDRHKDMVRLASGLQRDGTLSPESIERALSSLERFAERLRSTPDAQIRVVGTNTLRAAKNSDAFLQKAEKILGTPIHIISGIEEARLVYRGVAADYAPEARRLVIDIGGGSTELILGAKDPLALESLAMGCVSFSKQFFPDGKISKKRYLAALTAARVEAQDHGRTFGRAKWDEAVGASGTVRSVWAILEALGLNEDHRISAAGLEALSGMVVQHKSTADLNLPDLSDDRKPVLVGGLAVLHGLFLELGIQRMHVSNYAVREGLILDLIDRDQHQDLRSHTVKQMMQRYQVDTSQVIRVHNVAKHLIRQNREFFGREYRRCRRRLKSATRLHEIGLAIAHSDYHRHGAYLLENSDMPGFSKQEQKHLSFLVLNHRKKLQPVPATYGFLPNWNLVLILRLACLFSRSRDENYLPEGVELTLSSNGAVLKFSSEWANNHPLTMDLLKKERKYQSQQHYVLELSY